MSSPGHEAPVRGLDVCTVTVQWCLRLVAINRRCDPQPRGTDAGSREDRARPAIPPSRGHRARNPEQTVRRRRRGRRAVRRLSRWVSPPPRRTAGVRHRAGDMPPDRGPARVSPRSPRRSRGPHRRPSSGRCRRVTCPVLPRRVGGHADRHMPAELTDKPERTRKQAGRIRRDMSRQQREQLVAEIVGELGTAEQVAQRSTGSADTCSQGFAVLGRAEIPAVANEQCAPSFSPMSGGIEQHTVCVEDHGLRPVDAHRVHPVFM